MDFVIRGLDPQPFEALFGMNDAALRERGAQRVTATSHPGFPCRIGLRDAAVGDSLLLLHWTHLDADTPYRAGGPIFVGETARARAEVRNAIPEQQRSRLLSVRAYDAQGWMRDAEVVEGVRLEAQIEAFFADVSIHCLHVHNARRGCYACRIDRD